MTDHLCEKHLVYIEEDRLELLYTIRCIGSRRCTTIHGSGIVVRHDRVMGHSTCAVVL